MARRRIVADFEPTARYRVIANVENQSYDICDGETLIAFWPLSQSGYYRAYEECNRLNFKDAAQTAIDLADEEAARQNDDFLAELCARRARITAQYAEVAALAAAHAPHQRGAA